MFENFVVVFPVKMSKHCGDHSPVYNTSVFALHWSRPPGSAQCWLQIWERQEGNSSLDTGIALILSSLSY